MKFLLEIDKERNILRQTHLSGHGRRENDAEHAWHMAIMIYLLREYANEKIDLAKTMMMALIHDIVEIDAGDTYAYDTAALATQQEREAKAAQREKEKQERAIRSSVRSVGNTLVGTVGREVGKNLGGSLGGSFGKRLGGNLGASLGRSILGTFLKG